jgi:flagellar hook-length control protein FliK
MVGGAGGGTATPAAAASSAPADASDPNSDGASIAAPGAAPANTASASTAATTPGAAFAQALAPSLPAPGPTDAQNGDSPAGATPTPGTTPTPGATPVASVNASQGSTAASVVAAQGAQTATGASAASGAQAAKTLPDTAATAAINAATSTANAATGGAKTAANAGASSNSAATAQTAATAAQWASAAAVPAAAAVPVASGFLGDPDSSSSDDSPTPVTGSVAQDAVGPAASAPPVAVPASSPATVASAQAVLALADVSAGDKHSRSGNGDSSLPDASNDGTAGVAQLNTNTTSATDATPTPTLKVSPGVETPEFAQGVSDRVSWMVDNNLNGAKLQVNPPQLGPIEVRIAVQGDQAQVWLTAHSAVTRDALEASSPKLREMLGAQGFGQVSVDISQRSFQERSTYAQPYDWTPSASGGASAAAVSSTAASLPRTSSGAVDAYA